MGTAGLKWPVMRTRMLSTDAAGQQRISSAQTPCLTGGCPRYSTVICLSSFVYFVVIHTLSCNSQIVSNSGNRKTVASFAGNINIGTIGTIFLPIFNSPYISDVERKPVVSAPLTTIR